MNLYPVCRQTGLPGVDVRLSHGSRGRENVTKTSWQEIQVPVVGAEQVGAALESGSGSLGAQ